MSKLTAQPRPKTAPDREGLALAEYIDRIDDAERRIAALDRRAESLERQLRDSVLTRLADSERRLAATESRMSALSMPEQLNVMQALLHEQVNQFEWLTKAMRKVRDLLGDVGEEERADKADGSEEGALKDALPNVKTVLATLGGADTDKGLAGVLKSLGVTAEDLAALK